MSNSNFTMTIEVDQPVNMVYDAINNVAAWWHGKVVGDTTKLNNEFTYQMETFHFSTQKIVELVPFKKIVWLVTQSNLSFIQQTNEWTGTHIIFEIETVNNKTQIHFTHAGLTPTVECYGACSGGWTALIQKSLYSLITTGKGQKVF